MTRDRPARPIGRAGAFAVLFVLASCADPNALQSDTPVERFSGPIGPAAVADCLELEMQTIDPGNAVKKARAGEGYRVWGVASTVTVYDIDVQPGSGGSRVALRAYQNIWGGHVQPKATSDVIRKCVGA